MTHFAMFTAWSPMRSRSVTILSAAETVRRSVATGCCNNKSFRHSDYHAHKAVYDRGDADKQHERHRNKTAY